MTMIPVTKSFLPSQDSYNQLIKEVWDSGWLTNRGKLVTSLENKINSYLGTENVIAMSNGTVPLQIGIQALGLTGEVITTPFTYIASSSSLVWENCTPIFVDIEPDTLTIDPTLIESHITNKTTGILATHVYGNPCDVEAIDKIAQKHNLKVIYDAAHSFGVNYKGKSIFHFGDISTCSFHATKIFHSGEGGALFCNDELYDSAFYRHNFGHDGPHDYKENGINAKMSEFHAAMGHVVFENIDDILLSRKQQHYWYYDHLNGVDFIKIREHTEWNHSYLPILLRDEELTLAVIAKLNEQDIYPRRYFYPSLNTIDIYKNYYKPCEVSENRASRVLCLPLFHDLSEDNVIQICKIINKICQSD